MLDARQRNVTPTLKVGMPQLRFQAIKICSMDSERSDVMWSRIPQLTSLPIVADTKKPCVAMIVPTGMPAALWKSGVTATFLAPEYCQRTIGSALATLEGALKPQHR